MFVELEHLCVAVHKASNIAGFEGTCSALVTKHQVVVSKGLDGQQALFPKLVVLERNFRNRITIMKNECGGKSLDVIAYHSYALI